MVTKQAAATTVDASQFDPEAFIAGFKSPEFDVNLFRRADLIPKIQALREQIDGAGKASKGVEVGIADDDPAEALVMEHNALVDEFDASKVQFHFRVIQARDAAAVRDAFRADGLLDANLPEEEALEKVEVGKVIAYQMAETSLDPKLTGPQWLALRDAVGEGAFGPFWMDWQAGAMRTVPAPFSHLSSPSPAGEPS